MIISRGDLKFTQVWSGSSQTWGSNWSSTLQLGNVWAPYSAIYKRQHWVRTVVDKRALLLARLPLKVYRHDDLNRPEVSDHSYAQLLARPNRRQSRFAFWLELQTTYDIFGEFFIGKQRDGSGRPVALVPFHPTSMHEVETVDGRTIWEFDNGTVRIQRIPDEDLIHVRTYNPDSGTRGLSRLESLRATLENEDAALRAQSSFWKRGARPGVALSHPGVLSQPAADRLKLRWDQIASGADNVGTTVVLEEGMKPEILQLSAAEAQYIDGRKLNREEVIAAYDMPPPAVHVLDHATYSNIVQQLRSVYRDTMAPITVLHESELESQLRGSVRPGADGPDFGDDVYAEFLLDGVLRGDFEERTDAYQRGINSGWITPAEVRKLENLPFIEGSDQLFINSTMIPIVAAEEMPAGPAQLDDGQVRALLGRLSRQKSLEEVDRNALVAGLNGGSSLVLAQLDAAVAGGEGVMGLRERIKHLAAPPAAADAMVEVLKAIANREPVINILTPPPPGPRRLALRHDDTGTLVGLEELDGSR